MRSRLLLTLVILIAGIPSAAAAQTPSPRDLSVFRAGVWSQIQSSELYTIAPGASWRPVLGGGSRIRFFGEVGATLAGTTHETSVLGEVAVGVGWSRLVGPLRPEVQFGAQCWSGTGGFKQCWVGTIPQFALVYETGSSSASWLRGFGARVAPVSFHVAGHSGFVSHAAGALFVEIAL